MTVETPARGTRPRNRRDMILAATLRHNLETATEPMRAASGSDDPVLALATVSLGHPEFAVMWEREARHLPPQERREVARGIRVIIDAIGDVVRRLRPGMPPEDAELVTGLVGAALLSPSFHRTRLPTAEAAVAVARVATAVLRIQIPPGGAEGTGAIPRRRAPASSRREELLEAAIGLFAEHGYDEVGIEDIAARVGLTGNSIYRHFPTKADILAAAIIRGADWLRLDLTRAFAAGGDDATVLAALAGSYIALSTSHPQLIALLLSETAHLEDPDRARVVQEQRDYAAAWLEPLSRVHPEESVAMVKVRVGAVFTMANLSARNARLTRMPRLRPALEAAALAALGLP